MDFAILCFSSLMAIVDPIGLIPAFLAITPEKSAEDRIRISALACTLTFLVLSVFAFFVGQSGRQCRFENYRIIS